MISATNPTRPGELTQGPQSNELAELRRHIKARGLLDKQLAYYTYKIILTLGMLGLGVALLVILDNFWLQLLDGVFLAFAYSQIGYVGHDAGHQAIFRSPRRNAIVGLSVNFLISVSRTWWVTQHNKHHRYPNDIEVDPHIGLGVLAFSQEAAQKKHGLMRFVIRYQAFYFVPFLLLESIGIRLAGIQFLLRTRKMKAFMGESLLMGLHFGLYFGLLFYLLSPWQVLAFTLVHQLLFGLYFGLVFAPNHKGMLIPDKNNPLDFLRNQVLTSRNIISNPFVDFWYGGLNYQIEHHLFPMMPRNKLGEARKIVKPFCERHGISYHETGTFTSFREILTYLHRVSAPLRSEPGSVQKAIRE